MRINRVMCHTLSYPIIPCHTLSYPPYLPNRHAEAGVLIFIFSPQLVNKQREANIDLNATTEEHDVYPSLSQNTRQKSFLNVPDVIRVK